MLPSEAAVNQSSNSPAPGGASTPARDLLSPAFVIVLAAGTALRFLFLARKPFWFDECFSVEATRLDWSNFLHLLWWREANMSLYYLLLRGWLHFGQSEFFIRSLSVLAALATLPAIYWLGRLLFDRRVGLISAALLALNAYHIRYAQEARSYSLFVLLATLSSCFFVAFLKEPSHRNRLGYVLTSVLAVYAHFYALLLLAAQGLAPLLLPTDSSAPPARRTQLWRTQIWVGVLVLPLLIFVGKLGAGPIKWIPRPGLRDPLDYYEHMAGNTGWLGLALYALAIASTAVPQGKKLLTRRSDWDVWRQQFLLIWLFFPVVLTVLLSFARPVFYARYLIFCLPAFIILAAAGLARLQKTWQLATALAALLLLSLQGTFSYYDHDFDLERDGVGAASHYVLDHAQPGDAVLFHIAEARVPYEFYRGLGMGENPGSPSGPQVIFPQHADHLDYRDFTGKPTSEFLGSASAQRDRIWVVLIYSGLPDNPDPTTRLLTKTLGDSFPRMQPVRFPLVEVRLYSKK